jgi:nucleoporin NUP1
MLIPCIIERYRSGTPVNAAEKALQDLDAYKTPLLPTRLRMSSSQVTIPESMKVKKVHVPVPMKSKKDGKPRLGMQPPKPLKERKMNESKPYAGEGSVKKMIDRRRQEEQEDEARAAQEIEDRMDDGEDEQTPLPKEKRRKEDVTAKGKEKDEQVPTEPRVDAPFGDDYFAPLAPGASSGASSLRVGRQKQTRTHTEAPKVPRKTGASRFSAAFDEADDEEDSPRKAPPAKPMFAPPSGFSFAPPAVSYFLSVL